MYVHAKLCFTVNSQDCHGKLLANGPKLRIRVVDEYIYLQ